MGNRAPLEPSAPPRRLQGGPLTPAEVCDPSGDRTRGPITSLSHWVLSHWVLSHWVLSHWVLSPWVLSPWILSLWILRRRLGWRHAAGAAGIP